MAIMIVPTEEDSPAPGLATRIDDSAVRVAPHIAAALRSAGVRTAEDLLAYLEAFPTAAAALFGGDSAAVAREQAALAEGLRARGLLRERSTPLQRPGYGALDPALLGSKAKLD
jgi:hypothetical protein